jgi:hypothetical protein
MNLPFYSMKRPSRLALACRRGTAALEEVMVLVVMIPLVYGAFEIARMLCVRSYEIIGTIVGWPFL